MSNNIVQEGNAGPLTWASQYQPRRSESRTRPVRSWSEADVKQAEAILG
jgi:hypothetical protein